MWYKINWIYVWNQKVRPAWWSWQPWADTVAYYPLTSSTTTTDSQWNYNLSNSWNVTFGTHNSVSCAYFNWTSTSRLYNSSISYNSYPTYTVNCRFFLDYSGSRYQTIYTIWNTYATWLLWVWYNYNVNWWSIALWAYAGGYETVTQISISTNTRHNLVVVVNWSSSKQYLDWVQIATYTNSLSNTQTWLNLWCPSHNSSDTLWWWISEFILENKVWTNEDIENYYNKTKWDYWIS